MQQDHHEFTALADLIQGQIGQQQRLETQITGLSLHRWTHATEPASYMMAPSICLVGQGRKRLFLGDDTFVFDRHSFLITSVNLPVVAQVLEASPEQPYLGLTMELDLRAISELMLDNPSSIKSSADDRLSVAVNKLPSSMLDAFVRLLRLLDTPEDVKSLAPLIQWEIFYRLLKSEQGPRLRAIVSNGTQNHQMARVIDWLKGNFNKPVKMEYLAQQAGLSVSSFHSHFRAMTAMTPLQFLKKIRLNEARRLMLAEQLDASSAAFEVGYESPSQFSREYSRMFGLPPLRDIKQLSREQVN